MNKKLIRGMLFSLIIVTILLSLNARYVSTTYYRNIEGLYRYEQNLMPYELEIANTGSSHGLMGIDYSNYNEYKTFNFAFTAQRLFFDGLLLERYQEHLGENCVVIIPVSYFSFYISIQNLEEQVPRYVRILKLRDIQSMSIMKAVIYKYFPILSSKKGVINVFTTEHGELDFVIPNWQTEPDEWENVGKSIAESHLLHIDEAGGKARDEELDGFRKMLELCKKNGWKPVVITTPFTKSYTKWFTDEVIDQFHQIINESISDYPEAIYWDYSHDKRFENNHEYFIDGDHLSVEGRKRFTAILIEDCKKAGLLNEKNAIKL